MKLVTFEIDSPIGPMRRLGALLDGGQDGRVVDLNLAYRAHLEDETNEPRPDALAELRTPADMIEWIRGGDASREAADVAMSYAGARCGTDPEFKGRRGEQIVHARSNVRLLSPLPRPNTFRDFSVFEEHGSRTQGDDPAVRRYKKPTWFRWPPYYKGNPDSVFGPEDPIPYVYYTQKLDLEAEIGIVVGREGRNLSFDEATQAIVGYTMIIDCSDRGAGERNLLGPAKSKDFATMVGPCLVTADEIDEANLDFRVFVDDELWFEGSTSFPRSFLAHHLVAYASDNETLHAGDLLGTGTIGASAMMDLRRWIKVGQRYRFEVDGIGYLDHEVVAGEHVVDYVGSGMDGLLEAPEEAS